MGVRSGIAVGPEARRPSIIVFLIGAAASLSAAQSQAGEPGGLDGAGLVARLEDRCDAASRDPQGAINALFGTNSGTGGMTPDGALVQITETLPQPNPDQMVTFFFTQADLGASVQQTCSLNLAILSGDAAPIAPDLVAAVDGRADALLGGIAKRAGGPIVSGGLANPQRADMRLWHVAGDGGGGGDDGQPAVATLTLMLSDRFASLVLGRTVPSAD